MFDYDGTMLELGSQSELSEPSEKLLEALRRLASCDLNIVTILTEAKEHSHGLVQRIRAWFAVEHDILCDVRTICRIGLRRRMSRLQDHVEQETSEITGNTLVGKRVET